MENINRDGNEENRLYHYFGHDYVLVKELVQGGCQGCAFYTRTDCDRSGRSRICNEKHKIFKLHLNIDDK